MQNKQLFDTNGQATETLLAASTVYPYKRNEVKERKGHK